MMKSAFRCVQIVLLFYGVFGADEDEVKAVSVMEGDSVTLPTDQTQIKTFNLIEWRFGDPIIAQTDRKDISYPHDIEIFRDRLQLDLTGSLTIKNMKTKHSGLYQLKIKHDDGNAERKFSVTVYESTSDAGESEMRSESVIRGDHVTLQTGVTPISGDELIVWRFGDEGKVIAKADIEAKSSPLYYDERFRDRLELDQTGSLTITNTRTTDSGFYTVKITGRTQTVYKRFSVSVSEPGLSPGAVAGIVLLVLAVVAAAAAGFIYYRRKISELRKQILTVTGTEGDDVILKPNNTIQKGDVILWMFEYEKQQISIAKFTRETGEIVIYDYVAGGRFRGTLKLDTTGSLTIRNSRPEHSGLYTLYIISSSGDSQQRFIVTVSERVEGKSVDERGTVTLKPDTEIQRDDRILWMFGKQDNLIAQIREETGEICIYDDDLDGRFRGRLNLEKTGSLIITNIKPEHTGIYKLQISSSRGTLCKKFSVYYSWRHVFVTAGESVHLSTDRPKIERDDVIQWMCGDEIIAKIKGGTGKTYNGPDERFRDRLELNDRTGDLTIKNSTDEDAGDYNLKIISSKGNTDRTYRVFITVKRVLVTAGESVHLSTDRPKIERDDEIQWRCGDEIIAEIKEGTGKTHDGAADGRFRDRLQLNDQTGDLTIKSFTDDHAGDYKLKISSRKGNRNKTYRVIIRGRRVYVTEGESVHLSTDRPKIERDDVIEWMCGDEIIAEIKGGTGKTYNGPDERFRDRLQLNDRTGDLTIKNCTAEDEGYYNLKIISSKGNTNKTYRVTIRVEVSRVSVTEGESVHLSTDRPKIERGDVIQWRCGDEIIAEIKEGTGETRDGADGRFRDRLQLNDRTGDLTIKSCTDDHAGDYNLKIRSSKGNTDKTYRVRIRVRSVYVTAGESVHLHTDRPKIERDDVIEWMCGDEIIAEVKGETGKTHDGAADGIFRDRLQLNDQTGDLTIKNCTAEDEGDYKLKISSSKGNTNRTYSVIIRVAIKSRKESPVKGNIGKRVDESASVVIPLLDE